MLCTCRKSVPLVPKLSRPKPNWLRLLPQLQADPKGSKMTTCGVLTSNWLSPGSIPWTIILGSKSQRLSRSLKKSAPQLGRPLVDTVTASRHKNMKELRPGSAGRTELRILFAFDPDRQAILLLAGDKAGNWTRWYKKNIPVAD
ncbi:type II toxin-antitoxin system RelE/ParE family toxin, partial [Enteractinococcus helveticum]